MNTKPEKRVERTPGMLTIGGRYGLVFTEILALDGAKGICYGWTHKKKPNTKRIHREDTVPDPEGMANMAFIVQAWNAHVALLAACKHLDEWHDLIKQNYPEMFRAFEQNRAALALATVDPDDPATLARTADAVIESGVLEGGA